MNRTTAQTAWDTLREECRLKTEHIAQLDKEILKLRLEIARLERQGRQWAETQTHDVPLEGDK